MKRMVIVLLCVLGTAAAMGQVQEAVPPLWRIQPTLAIVTYFPGNELLTSDYYSNIITYHGLGAILTARFMNETYREVAFTLSGGAVWYNSPPQMSFGIAQNQTTNAGIGTLMRHGDFTVFPLSVGLHVTYPGINREKFMVFAGFEGSMNFISGEVDMNQQIKAGYAVVGGFAVSVFEFGLRYTVFSDMKNLGAQIGVRLNPIMLN